MAATTKERATEDDVDGNASSLIPASGKSKGKDTKEKAKKKGLFGKLSKSHSKNESKKDAAKSKSKKDSKMAAGDTTSAKGIHLYSIGICWDNGGSCKGICMALYVAAHCWLG